MRHLWDFIVERLRAQNLEAAEEPIRQALEAGQALVLPRWLGEIPHHRAARFSSGEAVLALRQTLPQETGSS